MKTWTWRLLLWHDSTQYTSYCMFLGHICAWVHHQEYYLSSVKKVFTMWSLWWKCITFFTTSCYVGFYCCLSSLHSFTKCHRNVFIKVSTFRMATDRLNDKFSASFTVVNYHNCNLSGPSVLLCQISHCGFIHSLAKS